jgi:hypothetical protein
MPNLKGLDLTHTNGIHHLKWEIVPQALLHDSPTNLLNIFGHTFS